MYDQEDSLKNDLLSGGLTVLGGYALGSLIKKYPGKVWPTGAAFVTGALLFATRKSVGRPWLQASMEGLSYLAFGETGMAIASNTETLGKIPAGPLVLNRATTTSAIRGIRPIGVPFGQVPRPIPSAMTSFAAM